MADVVVGLLGCLLGGLWSLYGRAELDMDRGMEENNVSRLHGVGTLATSMASV